MMTALSLRVLFELEADPAGSLGLGERKNGSLVCCGKGVIIIRYPHINTILIL